MPKYKLTFQPPTFANLQSRLPLDDIAEDQILFYDIETDHQYAPYARLNQVGVKYGFNGKPFVLRSKSDRELFAARFSDPAIWKVGFNNGNFDDIVLSRNGLSPHRNNWHDGYLMFKAIASLLPSYSLKFICWWFLGDHHFPEGKVVNFRKQTKTTNFAHIPPHLLDPYHIHDLDQHCNVFRLGYPVVSGNDNHWNAYMLDCAVVPAIQEMVLRGGLWIDTKHCNEQICKLAKRRDELNVKADNATDGWITNVNSTKQVGEFLDVEGLAITLTEDGNFSIRKKDLMDLRSQHPIAQMMYEVREINGTIKFFEAYAEAAKDKTYDKSFDRFNIWIPGSWSTSNARTRRFTSSSFHGINFQNPNSEAKEAQLVPPGLLGGWIDATQVENVVHIYESEDDARREAYEQDENWNEYVWLCQIIKGTNETKDELDDKTRNPSPVNPAWSIYKQFKIAKLALNFGMGVKKFCSTTGVAASDGYKVFEQIHDACPAIRSLQDKYADLVNRKGYVLDVFDHIYSGPVKKAYKIVAYAVQGCGTGSLPKAQIGVNYRTLHYRSRGFMCGTTHDDNSFRIKLDIGTDEVIATLQELMYNMTTMFTPRFGGIPLRAKLYLSKTNAKNAIEVNVKDTKTLRTIIDGDACENCNGAGCNECSQVGYTS